MAINCSCLDNFHFALAFKPSAVELSVDSIGDTDDVTLSKLDNSHYSSAQQLRLNHSTSHSASSERLRRMSQSFKVGDICPTREYLKFLEFPDLYSESTPRPQRWAPDGMALLAL